MFETILVPIDVTNPEKGRVQVDLAKKMGGKGARIVLTNVIEDVPAFVATQLPSGILEKSKEESKKELSGIAKSSGITAEIDVRTGHPATAILAAAKKTGADLIVIASHRPGMQDYLLGSTAARVVRHATCSVLVLR